MVVARAKEGSEEKQVVGYVVMDRQQAVGGEELRRYAKEALPDYMVPTAVVVLDKLPLTANGKVDRKQLPAPEAVGSSRSYTAPSTPTEQVLAQIWSEVLKIKQIGADDNFFDLGGHSLLATQTISRVRENFSTDLALRTMFESPTLSGLAAAIDAAKINGAVSGGPIQRASRQAYRAAQPGKKN